MTKTKKIIGHLSFDIYQVVIEKPARLAMRSVPQRGSVRLNNQLIYVK